jgi:glycosyltransferase involved in cell wall biosynthesis
LLLAVALASLGDDRRYVATLHGHDVVDALVSRTPLVPRLTRWALRRFTQVVAVSAEVAGSIREHVDAERLHVIPAFLDPASTSAELPSLTPDAERFFESGVPTLVVSCSQLPSRRGASDPYGVDIALRAFEELAPRRPRMRLALFVGRAPRDRGEREYLDGVVAQIDAAGLTDRFLLCVEEALVPALRHDVVYLRPTRTEGDAVSVREALALSVPVVASDVVGRPDGTILFPLGGAGLAPVLGGLLEQWDDDALPRRRLGPVAGDASDELLAELLAVYGIP